MSGTCTAPAFRVLVIGVVVAVSDTGAARASDCLTLPKGRMRVHVTAISTDIPTAGPTIRAVVSRVWAREGITIDWLSLEEARTLRDADAWIVARHNDTIERSPTTLGAAAFVGDEPRPVVRLSIDAVIRWVSGSFTGRPTPGSVAGFGWFAMDDSDTRVAQALGYVAAHELGHLWLGTREHARDGLMRPAFDSPSTLNDDPRESALDKRNRERLAERLASSAACR